ncbi:GntR family transcriptional regulator [Microbispora sp. NEAU-D428]|uniref:GntR family transcriptional regulator n=1 Tax=Microbispora sitophila TaxID=2771537 RepID=UPI00186883B9|nr:GntR family transcriptional regulator [Microbispora sitophila]MBE3015522.1 GntR family transcriptional regulator [Microbispora sitophila]
MSRGKAEAVYMQLKEQIQTLELTPGTKLSEVLIAEQVGASRTPVREAIRRLAREGLVRFRPGEVAQVAPISLRGVRALFEFRMILEPAAARMVTLDGIRQPELLKPFREISAELDEITELLDTAGREEVAPRFYRLTEQFDQAVIAACHNEPLATTIADQRGQSARLRRIAQSEPTRLRASLAEHRRMCEAILNGDPDGAAREQSNHLAESLDTIIRGLTSSIASTSDLDIEILPSA